jgi:hypothetical protein
MAALRKGSFGPKAQLSVKWSKTLNQFYQDPANLQIRILDSIYVVKFHVETNGGQKNFYSEFMIDIFRARANSTTANCVK